MKETKFDLSEPLVKSSKNNVRALCYSS